MASKYIRLMEEYKLARKNGDEDKAEQLFRTARRLLRSGTVSEDEITAASYL